MQSSAQLLGPSMLGEPTEFDDAPVTVGAPRGNWSRPIKKTIYTLNIGDYAPEICALTYPLMRAYA
jgi:hypothetical protein